MKIYIPEFNHSPYSVIVLSSVFVGILVASLLMKSVKAKRETILYTNLLAAICTVAMALSITLLPEQKSFQIGFSGLRAVIGLILSAVISCLIHKDHEKETCAIYVICAPLMYSLSKFGCLFAGCCNGRKYNGPFALIYHNNPEESYFPNQLVDIISFMLIFIILLFLFFKIKDKTKVVILALLLMIPARFLVEYLRESNGDSVISFGQIKVLLVGLISIVLVTILRRVIRDGK